MSLLYFIWPRRQGLTRLSQLIVKWCLENFTLTTILTILTVLSKKKKSLHKNLIRDS
jgi:hypothetical protein